MKKSLILLSAAFLLFGCKKFQNCYECKKVEYIRTHNVQNTFISGTNTQTFEFCGSESEMESTVAENTYGSASTGDTMAVTKCLLK